MTKLSVNLNKFALLRNSRGGNTPDVMRIARRCIARGVHGITVHPRPDERHARRQDVRDLAALLGETPGVELNVEGNPTSAFVALVVETRPRQVTLVPDAPDQLTSDHGWDAVAEGDRLVPLARELKAAGLRVSLFLDPDVRQVEAAARTGVDRIELYTEAYARSFGGPRQAETQARYAAAAARAAALGLGVNAGHDLNLENLGAFLDAVPGVLEVSIGHAIVCEAIDFGLEPTLSRYLEIVARAR